MASLSLKKDRDLIISAMDYILFSVVIILCVLGTIYRNQVWKDGYTLWADVVKKSPGSSRAHESFGYASIYNGKMEQGKEHLEIAFRINPNLTEKLMSRGLENSDKGMIDSAILEFSILLLFRPESSEAHYNLGVAYDRKGWVVKAIEQYEIAIKLKPDFADAYNNLGTAYGTQGLIEKAIENFQAAIKFQPKDASFHYNLSKAYRMKGLQDKAEEEIIKAKNLKNR